MGMINTVVVEEEEEEDCEEVVGNSKDLMRFLGMKDGVTASMASQGTLSDDCVRLSVNNPMAQVQKSSEPVTTQATSLSTTAKATDSKAASTTASRSSSIGSTPLDRIIQKQSSQDKENS